MFHARLTHKKIPSPLCPRPARELQSQKIKSTTIHLPPPSANRRSSTAIRQQPLYHRHPPSIAHPPPSVIRATPPPSVICATPPCRSQLLCGRILNTLCCIRNLCWWLVVVTEKTCVHPKARPLIGSTIGIAVAQGKTIVGLLDNIIQQPNILDEEVDEKLENDFSEWKRYAFSRKKLIMRAKELGREPSNYEIFKSTHWKRKEENGWMCIQLMLEKVESLIVADPILSNPDMNASEYVMKVNNIHMNVVGGWGWGVGLKNNASMVLVVWDRQRFL
ncbi:hypothetical protein ACS0TY_035509 [Phlomoides rotata]